MEKKHKTLELEELTEQDQKYLEEFFRNNRCESMTKETIESEVRGERYVFVRITASSGEVIEL